MKEINYRILIIVLVIALVLFFGGSWLLTTYKLNYVLSNDLIEIKGVDDVIIDRVDSKYQVKIFLSKVVDLEDKFKIIKDRIEGDIDSDQYSLVFDFESSPVLERVYDQINLALYEALETGEFVELGERLDLCQIDYKLDLAMIKVDMDYLYLSIAKDNKRLYKVINRNLQDEGRDMNG